MLAQANAQRRSTALVRAIQLTVVVGLFVVVFLYRSGPLGDLNWFCTRQGMVIAQSFLALPAVIGLTAIALQSVDPLLPPPPLSLGAPRWQAASPLVREARLLVLRAVVRAIARRHR